MNIYRHLPETVSYLKAIEPTELPHCLCGNLIDSDDPDEAFCMECKMEGSELRYKILGESHA
jgi:hypothetical protein